MKKCTLVLLFSLCFLAGCPKHQAQNTVQSGASVGAATSVQGLLPLGARLGSAYLSALNENCFEVFPAGSPSAQMQAICMREGSWQLLPPIYIATPDKPSIAPVSNAKKQ